MSPSNKSMTQGAKANAAGRAYEGMLRPLFEQYGYETMTYSQWKKKKCPAGKEGKLALKNAPFDSIYDHKGRTEWLLVNDERGTKVRVEVKSQRGNGSVDEKIPYTYLNAVEYPEDDVILLIEGDGFKKGMRPWLQKAIDDKWMVPKGSGKNIKMMNLSEFTAYFISELS